MKTVLNQTVDSAQKKKKIVKQPIVWLIILGMVLIYVFGIRPLLKPSMATTGLELIIAVGALLVVIGTFLVLLFTLLITLIVALRNRNNAAVKAWLLRLRGQFITLCITILVFSGIVVCSQYLAYTPPILDENGKKLEGSIATLEKVNLNGSKQWISIRGKNKDNPVLLFLAGGPGGTQLAATRIYLQALEDYFVVVSWDQPGAAKSYGAVPRKEITLERYIKDGLELTQYLRKKFNKEKIYVLGESWGSTLGVWMIQRQPELFTAFIGTGQMVSYTDTELMCYEFAMKVAAERGDLQTVEKLKKQGLPPYYGKDVVWKEAAYLMYLFNYMATNPQITGPSSDMIKCITAPEYGLYDKVNYIRGVTYTLNDVFQLLYDVDFRKQATELKVPVYILHGRHDVNAPTVLVDEYYQLLNAPDKKLIWFEHAGHNPWIEENETFIDTMVNVILKETSTN